MIKDKQTGFIANDMNDFADKMLTFYTNTDLLLEFSDNFHTIDSLQLTFFSKYIANSLHSKDSIG